ncbi:MAG TPA: hypothetical protein VEK33_25300 [Terriglobales bacterium]|nr:hypothetical protein [Terriglobales bacterium]
MRTDPEWKTYRTRFLIKARQLTEPMVFVDALGREHRGHPGDYLIESSDGCRSIQRREIFEDIYVPLGAANPAEGSGLPAAPALASSPRPRISARPGASV